MKSFRKAEKRKKKKRGKHIGSCIDTKRRCEAGDSKIMNRVWERKDQK